MAAWVQELLQGLFQPARGDDFEQKPRHVGVNPQQLAIDLVASSGLPVHPQANRQVVLAGVAVAYQLRRSARRSIGFVVRSEGLLVAAPRWVSLAQIDQALQAKSAWVLRKLSDAGQRQATPAPPAWVWADGACLPYLGQPLTLVLDPGAPRRAAPVWDAAQAHLHLPLAAEATPAQIQRLTQAWFRARALAWYTERLNHFAPQLRVQWRSLSLTRARTRWGSAKADGSIRLHEQLIHLPPVLIDYVVVHELSHLRVMNHSPAFWATVAEVMPDHAVHRRVLRQVPIRPV